MEFPEDILKIIREYSKPMTRPDWRSLQRMPSYRFHILVSQTLNRNSPQVVYELTNKPGPEYNYHIEFYEGLPYIVYIYGKDQIPLYVPFF
jgi:hypothetical protein